MEYIYINAIPKKQYNAMHNAKHKMKSIHTQHTVYAMHFNFKFWNKSYLYTKLLAEMHTVTSCFKSIIATTFTPYSEYIDQEVRMKANKV